VKQRGILWKTLNVERYKKANRFYEERKTMTLMTDAKKLLDKCQTTEESILDVISFCSHPVDLISVQYSIKRVSELIEECQEMIRSLTAKDAGSKTVTLRNNLRRTILRLEAVRMYAKNYFKL
jgi:seryl-tRNA(Sec) selenium transferase